MSRPAEAGGRPGIASTRLPGLTATVLYGSLFVAEIAVWLVILVQGAYAWLLPNLDFMGSYMGAYLLVTGQGARLYDLTAQLHVQALWAAPAVPAVHLFFLYPGWNAVALAPLGALSYPWAFAIWETLNLAAVATCIIGLVRATARTRLETRVLVLVAAGFAPLAYALFQAQLSLLIWLGFTGAFLSLRAGRDRQAGIWLTLALLKPQILVLPLLALLLLGRWRAVRSFAVSLAAIFAASLLVLGNWVPGYLRFILDFVGANATGTEAIGSMTNWRGLVYRLFGTDRGLLPSGLIAALTVASIALLLVLCWPRASRPRPGWEVGLALAILLGLLIDPHCYPHDTTVALLAGFILWRSSDGPAWRLRLLRAVLMAIPVGAFIEVFGPPIGNLEVGAWCLALLAGTLCWAWSDLRGTMGVRQIRPEIVPAPGGTQPGAVG